MKFSEWSREVAKLLESQGQDKPSQNELRRLHGLRFTPREAVADLSYHETDEPEDEFSYQDY